MIRGSRAGGICLLAVGLIAGSPALASTLASSSLQESRFAGVRTSIQDFIVENDVPSLCVAVVEDDEVVWAEAFGWADREDSVRATASTIYSIASTSKPMTATAVMLLVERGLVDLDRPVDDYLGTGELVGLAGDTERATVRRILSHTAGLPSFAQFFYTDIDEHPPDWEETIGRYGILVAPPGEVYQYSNLGYAILERVIEQASGRSYSEFMRSEVFRPLDMEQTSVGVDSALKAPVARRYGPDRQPLPFYTTSHPGGSGIYSSVHDLIRFARLHLWSHDGRTPRLLADSTIALMQTVHTPATPAGFAPESPGDKYGLGWNIRSEEGYWRVDHSGWMPGVISVLDLYPRANAAVAVLANARVWPQAIIEEIEALLLRPHGDGSGAGSRVKPDPDRASATRRDRLPVDLLGVWAGALRTWKGSVPLVLTVHPGGRLSATLGRHAGVPVSEVSWRDGVVSGRFSGLIPADDAMCHPHSVVFELRRAGDALRGQVSAFSGWSPRYYFLLPSYAELVRRPGPAARE